MAKPFRRLIEGMPAERRARIEGRTNALVEEYQLLRELRLDRNMTQEELAAIMGVRQASISKFENQSDMRLGTLRRYVEALGGELEISVRFPDEDLEDGS
jgi:DNA-binding XRE family transcriptional regulator